MTSMTSTTTEMLTRGHEINNIWLSTGWAASSVDFCEANFTVSKFVAEPMNAASAAPLILLGVVGARWSDDRDIQFLFVLLVAVGLGTVALHATLSAPGQALDEVPMLVLTIALFACLVDAVNPGRFSPTALFASTVSATLAVIVWYFRFQHIYLVFLVSYGALVVAIVLSLAARALIRRSDSKRDATRRRVIRPLFFYGIVAYVVAGFVAWCTDMLFCDSVSAWLGGGLLLHPLWHLGAALGTWAAIFNVVAIRADLAQGQRPILRWCAAGLLPYCRVVETHDD